MSDIDKYKYYDEDGITIYHGDCRDILPQLEPVDLVLTDPPYGIADVWKGGSGHGWGKANTEKPTRNTWDAKTPDRETLETIIAKATYSIIWGGNYFQLPISRGWLVWVKPEREFTLSEAELGWTNKDTVMRVCECHRSDSDRAHPTQKPIYLMKWCISWLKKESPDIILDPFMGSGTTLVAAQQLGRKAIGIEICEDYCRIAVDRLRQGVLGL